MTCAPTGSNPRRVQLHHESKKKKVYYRRLAKEYKLEIAIRENGIRIKKTLALKIDKPSHEITIRKAKATARDENGRITARLENTGCNEEKGNILIESKSLRLNRKIPSLLDEGECRTFTEPCLITEKKHTITITAEYNRRSITKGVPVEDC